ncbi:GNAT family acetyltransferase [Arthrobacter sp. RIT-PI-e]|uniref:GNAT family N-acetyltransferase n=1 Tax=Arthrobacter sp. RIT-PI-e TaxID=1681197 RepID=UPI000676A910|nr:GNAT family protein [Arthrobacter sp. RIT-PI-e]KNC20236.1 GNAT family acetyltransferase [Arthrobacter sp. RIT-PI-e]
MAQHAISLSGPLVRLDPSTEDDAPSLWELTDEDLWAGMPSSWPASVDEFTARLRVVIADPGRMAFTVRDTATGEPVGSTTFYDFVPSQRRIEIGSTWYGRQFWGGRTNPATKLLLLTHAFEELHVNRVGLRCDVRNTRSARAIQRLGARPEGILRSHRIAADGTVSDTAYFGITTTEWPDVRAQLEERLLGHEGSRSPR